MKRLLIASLVLVACGGPRNAVRDDRHGQGPLDPHIPHQEHTKTECARTTPAPAPNQARVRPSRSSLARPEDVAQARALFEQATNAFRLERYDFALVLYQRAYALFPHPEILYDVALVELKLQHYERSKYAVDAATRQACEEQLHSCDRIRHQAEEINAAYRKWVDNLPLAQSCGC